MKQTIEQLEERIEDLCLELAELEIKNSELELKLEDKSKEVTYLKGQYNILLEKYQVAEEYTDDLHNQLVELKESNKNDKEEKLNIPHLKYIARNTINGKKIKYFKIHRK